jgi:hypothetical protein
VNKWQLSFPSLNAEKVTRERGFKNDRNKYSNDYPLSKASDEQSVTCER